ncbi:MAG: LmeA family phospholipid-binding protein [Acidimicrobiales bacterium]
MRKLLFLAVVLGLLAGADVAARKVAEQRIADRAEQAAGEGATATARISSFPFVARLLVSGSVPKVSVHARAVKAGAFRLSAVNLDLDGVALDRHALYGGTAKLRDIDEGTVTVELDAALLSGVLELPVTIEDGAVRVGVLGQQVTAKADVRDGVLILGVAGIPALRVPVARTELSPCDAAAVEVAGDRLRLTCRVRDVPPALVG